LEDAYDGDGKRDPQPQTGQLDLSPLVAILALVAVQRIVDALFSHYS
jgi:uncharacterized protein YggT (Ycf19 family)